MGINEVLSDSALDLEWSPEPNNRGPQGPWETKPDCRPALC